MKNSSRHHKANSMGQAPDNYLLKNKFVKSTHDLDATSPDNSPLGLMSSVTNTIKSNIGSIRTIGGARKSSMFSPFLGKTQYLSPEVKQNHQHRNSVDMGIRPFNYQPGSK